MNRKLAVAISLMFCAVFTKAMAAQSGFDENPGNSEENPVFVGPQEVRDHRPAKTTFIRTRLTDQQIRAGIEQIYVWVTVSPDGFVTKATSDTNAPNQQGAMAEEALRKINYTPFERGGRREWVKFQDYVNVYPPELVPAVHVPFPDVRDWTTVHMTLERSGCFGSCPAYKVEIDGDGTVHFNGEYFVTFEGGHRAFISLENVKELVNRFRAADFFSLQDEYNSNWEDIPGYRTSLAIGDRKKEVLDLEGLSVGMPIAVSDIEDAIDSVAGTDRWTKGTPETVNLLKAENWNFKSKEAADTLARAALYGNVDIVRALLAEGVSLNGRVNDPGTTHQTALELAAAKGNVAMLEALLDAGAGKGDSQGLSKLLAIAIPSRKVELLRALLSHGANVDARDSSGKTILMLAVGTGIPEVVKEVLNFRPDVNARDTWRSTALIEAVYHWKSGPRGPGESLAEVVRMLLTAGADPNAVDREGNTALIYCEADADAALALIKAGAKVNAKDSAGETLLMKTPSALVAQVLLQNGADVSDRDEHGRTALEGVKLYGWEAKAALLQAVQGKSHKK